MRIELDGEVFDTDNDLSVCGQSGADEEGNPVTWTLYQKAAGQYYIYSETIEEPNGGIMPLTRAEANEILSFVVTTREQIEK